jgi:hypothetical protein
MVTDFYSTLYTSEGVQGVGNVLEHVPQRVTPDINSALCAPYTSKEVKTALFQMFPTKAPSPDGFPAHFYQRHWDTCGEEVTNVMLRIVRGEESAECINETIIVLIHKVPNPSLLSQLHIDMAIANKQGEGTQTERNPWGVRLLFCVLGGPHSAMA